SIDASGEPRCELRYSINKHQGPITSLHFTPQCRLVSASQDHTIRVWPLHENGAGTPLEVKDRSGNIAQLGVSADVPFMLCDQGKSLHLVSVRDTHTLNTMQSPGGNLAFETLAILSPDSSLLMTASEGGLLLWSTPDQDKRGVELRQLVTKEHARVTCAAF